GGGVTGGDVGQRRDLRGARTTGIRAAVVCGEAARLDALAFGLAGPQAPGGAVVAARDLGNLAVRVDHHRHDVPFGQGVAMPPGAYRDRLALEVVGGPDARDDRALQELLVPVESDWNIVRVGRADVVDGGLDLVRGYVPAYVVRREREVLLARRRRRLLDLLDPHRHLPA